MSDTITHPDMFTEAGRDARTEKFIAFLDEYYPLGNCDRGKVLHGLISALLCATSAEPSGKWTHESHTAFRTAYDLFDVSRLCKMYDADKDKLLADLRAKYATG